jgi:hypothetical protein
MIKNKKSALQKSTVYFGASSFIASVVSVVYLYLNIDALGWENPISASLLASSFFFAFVGVVLMIIGNSNIPSFKVNDSE